MKSFILSSEQVSKNFDFSPEYWISNSLLDDNGSSLLDFVDIVNKATSEQEGKYIILDTTHTNNGLLLIQSMDINNPIERKSSKKEVNEGISSSFCKKHLILSLLCFDSDKNS